MKKAGLFLVSIALAFSASGLALSAVRQGFTVKVPLTDWTAVASKKGWLQEEFARAGAKVKLVDVAALKIPGVESSLLEKGDLHFAARMAYPALQHKLNGLDAVVVWASQEPHPRRATTIVLKESAVTSLADLKGKSIGGNRFGCPYFASYEALKDKGIQQDTDTQKGEVGFVQINSSTATTSLLSGKVDSLSVHPSAALTTALYTKGLVREIAASVPGGAYVKGGGRTAIFAMRNFARKNPELVQAYIRAYERTRKWIVDNPDAASAIIAREMRIPGNVAKYGIVDSSQLSYSEGEPEWKTAVNSYKLFQEWGIKNGDDFLKKKNLSQAQIEAFVDKRFFKGGQYYLH